jgi:carboxymethylenebutenolidase
MQLTASDGHQFNAYVAQSTGPRRGALIVIQEIFGVNGHIRAVVDHYASQGYWAIAPALFDRVQPNVELGYGARIARGVCKSRHRWRWRWRRRTYRAL